MAQQFGQHVDKYGLSPLHYAAIYQNAEAIKALLPVFAKMTTQKRGAFPLHTTALMIAVKNLNKKCIELLKDERDL